METKRTSYTIWNENKKPIEMCTFVFRIPYSKRTAWQFVHRRDRAHVHMHYMHAHMPTRLSQSLKSLINSHFRQGITAS